MNDPHNYYRLKSEWLNRHHLADIIAVDEKTGEPVYAEYLWLNGVKRQYPARFLWPEPWMYKLHRL